MLVVTLNDKISKILTSLAVSCCLLIAGCGDEQVSQQDSATENNRTAIVESRPDWLELKDDAIPSDWLIERSRAAGRPVNDTEIKELRSALSIAVLRLGESARMIVNRSAQLETMLKSEGHDESAIRLVPMLTGAIGETGQTEGFGAVSQHYYNMRKAGMTSAEALEDLRKRYGPRG